MENERRRSASIDSLDNISNMDLDLAADEVLFPPLRRVQDGIRSLNVVPPATDHVSIAGSPQAHSLSARPVIRSPRASATPPPLRNRQRTPPRHEDLLPQRNVIGKNIAEHPQQAVRANLPMADQRNAPYHERLRCRSFLAHDGPRHQRAGRGRVKRNYNRNRNRNNRYNGQRNVIQFLYEFANFQTNVGRNGNNRWRGRGGRERNNQAGGNCEGPAREA